jgi:hypothetical protein
MKQAAPLPHDQLDVNFGHSIFPRMRALIALLLIAAPVHAWDFTSVPVCTIAEDTADLSIRVTYDPSQPEPYAISLTRTDVPWPATDSFGLRFDGPAALTIGTARHQLSADGRTLTVSDTGFGNVLDGLALNGTATALAGDTADGSRPSLRGVASVPSGGAAGHTKA